MVDTPSGAAPHESLPLEYTRASGQVKHLVQDLFDSLIVAFAVPGQELPADALRLEDLRQAVPGHPARP